MTLARSSSGRAKAGAIRSFGFPPEEADMEIKVPNFMRRNESTGLGTAEEMPSLPVTAELPKPPDFSQADQQKMIMQRAAVIHDQLMRDRAEAKEREDQLQIALAEAVLAREGDVKKIGFLELENVQLRNDIATLQSDIEKFREFMSKIKAVLDLWGVKKPEKKPRKPKALVIPPSPEPPHD